METDNSNEILCTSIMLNKALDAKQPAVALHNAYKLTDIEALLPERVRPRGEYTTSNFADFVDYVKAKGDAAATTVFVAAEVAVARLDHSNGKGHCVDTARYTTAKTDIYDAFSQLPLSAKNTRDLMEFLEDWALSGQIVIESAKGVITISEALSALRNITIDTARSLANREENFASELTASEKIALRDADNFPYRLILNDVAFEGTKNEVNAEIAIRLVTKGDDVGLRLRQVGEALLVREKAEEIRDTLTKETGFTVYFGNHNPR